MRNWEAAERVWQRTGFTPNDDERPILECNAPIVLLAGGVRAGKSTTGARGKLVGELLSGELFWIVANKYELTDCEYDYAATDIAKLFPRELVESPYFEISQVERGPRTFKIGPGKGTIRIQTKSGADIEGLAAEAPDGVLVCEAAQISWTAIERLMERVIQKRGWMFLEGTFEASVGWYVDKWFEWQHDNYLGAQSFSLPTWSNKALFPGGEHDPELEKQRRMLGDAKFYERYGGVPSPPSKRVYSQFNMEENVLPLELLREEGEEGAPDKKLGILPVQLWIDPGFACYAIEAAQVVRGDPMPTYRLFAGGELYAANCMTEDAIGWVKRQEWCGALDRIVIDIAARQRQAQRSIASMWAEAFPQLPVVTNYVQKSGGIDKAQSVIATRRLLVDPSRQGLIAEMGCAGNPIPGQTYYRWKERTGGIIMNLTEDDSDHACSAVVYGIIAQEGYLSLALLDTAQRAYDWKYGS